MALKIIVKSAQTLSSFGSQMIHKSSSLKTEVCAKLWQGLGKSCSKAKTFSSVAPQTKESVKASVLFNIILAATSAKFALDYLSLHPAKAASFFSTPKTLSKEDTRRVSSNFANLAVHAMTTSLLHFHPMGGGYEEATLDLIKEFLDASLLAKLNSDPTSIFNQDFAISISPNEIRSFIKTRTLKPTESQIGNVPFCTVSISPQSFVHLMKGNWNNVKIILQEPELLH